MIPSYQSQQQHRQGYDRCGPDKPLIYGVGAPHRPIDALDVLRRASMDGKALPPLVGPHVAAFFSNQPRPLRAVGLGCALRRGLSLPVPLGL